jgi:hypothetical protein
MDRLGERYRVLAFRKAVLDLSCRSDIAPVTMRLKGLEVNL